MGRPRFPIVGIGASAGGLESLERFFRAAPTDAGMAYVVVQHLSPNFKSMMPQLLARQTTLTVHSVETGMRVERDSIYLLPPGKQVVLVDGRFALSDKARGVLTLPIDCFLESLARYAGTRAAAVILSGTGSDGSAGSEQVKEAGGVVLAEAQSTAKFYGMPRSVVERGVVDAILVPDDMPDALRRVFTGEPLLEDDSLEGLDRLLRAIQVHEGLDFRDYNSTTLLRRTKRRAQLLDVSDEELVRDATTISARRKELVRDYLIHVSSFFRDRSAFEALTPHLRTQLESLPSGDVYRVWAPGCATGQEAYSLAMLLEELNDDLDHRVDYKIFATDISGDVLRTAGVGRYDREQVVALSNERLERFFEAKKDGFSVKRALRDRVVFSPHNLLLDPPFTNIHLVSCRNLLIYLTSAAQERALSYMHFGLRKDGLLFLGASETTTALPDGFVAVTGTPCLYRRRQRAARLIPTVKRRDRSRTTAETTTLETASAYAAICQQVLPPSIILDDEHCVLETFGGAERFLSIKPRKLDTSFLSLIDANLKGSLAGALRVLERDGAPMVVRGISVGEPEPQTVDLHLERVTTADGEQLTLVSFVTEDQTSPTARSREFHVDRGEEDRLEGLEDELRRTRRHLQETVEQLEASNEELQATNEELVASNEELQSTNEELSSVNEELYTVNTEYQRTIDELRSANADIEHLLARSDIATLFLDGDLRVRRFTPDLSEVIDLEEQDVGRRITTFQHRLEWPGFYDAMTQVLDDGETVEKEVGDAHSRRLLVRISRFANADGSTGLVLTLTDVTGLATARARLRRRERELRELSDALPVLVARVDRDLVYRYVNGAYVRLYGVPREEIVGQRFGDLTSAEELDVVREHIDRALAGEIVSYEIHVTTPKGPRQMLVTCVPREHDGELDGFYAAVTDVSASAEAREHLEEAKRRAEEASGAKTQFLANMSHEIRTPLAAVLGYAELLADHVQDDKGKEFLDTIQRNGEHLLATINDVLDLSRIEDDRIALSPRPFALAKLLRGVIELYRERAESQGLELTLTLPKSLPARVVTDPQRLRQILFNLVSNAIKFTEEGSVSLVLAPVHGKSPTLDLRVRDTGVGFSPEHAAKLFEPFEQGDASHERRYGGTGLGLTISQRLVEALGGSLTASSEPGVGSEFHVRLPVELPADAVWIPVERASAPELPAVRPAREPLHARVLVVDDAEDIRKLVALTLRREEARVVEVESGLAALELIEEDAAWDLIVMDVQMPGLDGLKTTQRLRERGIETPVLALTARALEEDREASLAAGCDEHLPKPVDAAMLVSVARRLTRSRGPTRVMLVDDDEDVVQLLRMALEREGFEVQTARDADEVRRTLTVQAPDLVISDLNMDAWGDGLELGAELRRRVPSLPLIALSGAAEMKEQALKNGFDEFLLKPVPARKLASHIDRLLARRRSPSTPASEGRD